MTTPQVSDDDRRTIEEAIAAALLLLIRGHARMLLDRLAIEESVTISDDLITGITSEAQSIARTVQAGINLRLSAVAVSLSLNNNSLSLSLLERGVVQEIESYHRETLLPYIRSWARNHALVAVYRGNVDPLNPEKRLHETHDWYWDQMTDFPDDCRDASAASPTDLDDLLSVGGGVQPTHRNCACTLRPERQ